MTPVQADRARHSASGGCPRLTDAQQLLAQLDECATAIAVIETDARDRRDQLTDLNFRREQNTQEATQLLAEVPSRCAVESHAHPGTPGSKAAKRSRTAGSSRFFAPGSGLPYLNPHADLRAAALTILRIVTCCDPDGGIGT